MRTLCEIMRIFDRLDVEERELPPLPAYQTVSWEQLVSPTPGANVVEDAGVDLDDVWAADESMSRANSGPFSASASASAVRRTFPRPHTTAASLGVASSTSTSTTNSNTHGILWSPQVAHPCKLL